MKLKHLAIIPDGNRRWAREKGLPEFFGHKYAAEKTLPKLIDKVRDLGIKYFTFWAMSTENFKNRSKEEIDNLLNLLKSMLENKVPEFKKNKTRFKAIGRWFDLPEDVKEKIIWAMRETEDYDDYFFTLAINYGGRDELVRAINQFILDTKGKTQLIKEDISHYLDTAFMPDPDLIIRTGKEKRVSGFMLWQSEYAEYYFSDKYFPEFTPKDLESAVNDFLHRQRRFGK